MRDIVWRPSPNFGSRRGGREADLLILHYTGMISAERACDWLCNPQSNVSSHYLVDEAGGIIQMVQEDKRAWHAGISSWQGESDINSRSIGIEIHNPGHSFGYPDFAEPQMQAVVELCRAIVERHRIAPELVLAHSDVAPGRKVDPGEKFDWRRLHAEGIGIWVEPAEGDGRSALRPGDRGDEVAAWQSSLASYGYGIEATGLFDDATAKVTAAFQRHFRPACVDGIADSPTRATLDRLIALLFASPVQAGQSHSTA